MNAVEVQRNLEISRAIYDERSIEVESRLQLIEYRLSALDDTPNKIVDILDKML